MPWYEPHLRQELSTSLLPTPVGLRVVALESQLLYVGAVGQHGPYLVGSRAVGLKHNVAAVRRPAGEIVAPRIVRELYPLLAGDIHQIQVVGTRFSGPVLAHPGERQKLSVRRPVGRNGIALIGDPLQVGAVRFHGVDLRQAGAPADERDLAASFAIPGWSNVGPLVVSQAARVSSGGIDYENIGVAVARGGEGDLALGRPRRRKIHASKTRKGDHAVEIERRPISYE